VPAGRVSDQIWAFWDVMPTLTELAGLPPLKGTDGISMLPTLLGKEQKQDHDCLYWDYGHVRGNYKQAVRLGNWKGVRNKPGAPLELYDLLKDIGETRDVAQQHPDVVSRIEQSIKEAYVDSPQYPIAQP